MGDVERLVPSAAAVAAGRHRRLPAAGEGKMVSIIVLRGCSFRFESIEPLAINSRIVNAAYLVG